MVYVRHDHRERHFAAGGAEYFLPHPGLEGAVGVEPGQPVLDGQFVDLLEQIDILHADPGQRAGELRAAQVLGLEAVGLGGGSADEADQLAEKIKRQGH